MPLCSTPLSWRAARLLLVTSIDYWLRGQMSNACIKGLPNLPTKLPVMKPSFRPSQIADIIVYPTAGQSISPTTLMGCFMPATTSTPTQSPSTGPITSPHLQAQAMHPPHWLHLSKWNFSHCKPNNINATTLKCSIKTSALGDPVPSCFLFLNFPILAICLLCLVSLVDVVYSRQCLSII